MNSFTKAQQDAIAARGNVLVVAGAGTGKTHTLVERCLTLLLDEGCSLENILMVTFTEAAAAEMRHRIRRALLKRQEAQPDHDHLARQLALLDTARISTLHGFCLGLVREHFYELGLDPQVAVLDERQTQPLIHETFDALFAEHYAATTPEAEVVRELIRRQGRGSEERIRALALKLHRYTQTLPNPARWFEEQLALFAEPEPAQWREWFVEGVREWAALWLPPLREIAGEAENVARCVRALGDCRGAGFQPAREGISPSKKPLHDLEAREDRQDACPARLAYALAEILAADAADWPKKRKTELRGPIKKFFEEAEFLHSLTSGTGAAPVSRQPAVVNETTGEDGDRRDACPTDPLAEDWQWIRGPMAALLRLARAFGERFAQAKRELGGVDFADLEQFALRLLRDPAAGAPTAIARQWQERFQHIFVDEYQDINEAQDSIIECLSRAGERANRFLVGDVKQSIYRFRLANPRIFSRYEEAWRADAARGRRISLADNFRSREAILEFVNPLFATLMRPAVGGLAYDEDARLRFGNREERKALALDGGPVAQVSKPAVSPTSKSAGPAGSSGLGEVVGPAGWETRDPADLEVCATGQRQPCVEFHLIAEDGENGSDAPAEDLSTAESELLDLQSNEREARLVAVRLRELMAAQHPLWDAKAGAFRPAQWGDMVVLLRSPSSRVESFAKEFSRLGVPLQAARGGFYESAEIMDVLSLLQVLDNPLQDVPLLAVLRSPLVGLSLDELVEIRVALRPGLFWTALKRWHQINAECGMRNAELPAGDAGAIPHAAHRTPHFVKVDTFLTQYARWRRIAREGSLTECLETALAETAYEALLQAGARGKERVANVRRLLSLARQFDPYQRQGLFRFLRFVEAQQAAALEEEPAPLPTQDAVRLMSIHKSKGLEFPVVAVAGLGTRFNFQDLHADILLNEFYGLCPKVLPPDSEQRYPSLSHWLATRREKRELLGEELRLLYVAMTRARDTLLLIGTASGQEAGEPWPSNLSPSSEPRPEPLDQPLNLALPDQGDWGRETKIKSHSKHAEARDWAGAEPTDRDLLDARCPLDWLRRWLPQATAVSDWTGDRHGQNELLRWKIYLPADPCLLREKPETEGAAVAAVPPEPEAALVRRWRARLLWQYPCRAATQEPAKTTVSVLRRRTVEDTDEETRVLFRSRGHKSQAQAAATARASHAGLSAAERGTAHHAFMECVNLERVESLGELRNEVARLASQGLLAAEAVAALDLDAIVEFWQSELGRRIRAHRSHVHREVPFTARFTPEELAAAGIKLSAVSDLTSLAGEFIVVQGAVDLAVIAPEEIWLLDFKTDHVKSGELAEKARSYEPQLNLYAHALARIYRRPVQECWLHFFALGRSAAVRGTSPA